MGFGAALAAGEFGVVGARGEDVVVLGDADVEKRRIAFVDFEG